MSDTSECDPIELLDDGGNPDHAIGYTALIGIVAWAMIFLLIWRFFH